MTNETKKNKELKSYTNGWTGGFGAPKQKTRSLGAVAPEIKLDLIDPADNEDPRSQRRLSAESQTANELETHWYDCFGKCGKK